MGNITTIKNRKKICFVATVPFALSWFMTPHIRLLCKEYDVTLISSGSPNELNELLYNNVSFVTLDIKRKISLKKDVLALIRLWSIFKENQFDCVHSITPKAGLLTMLAGKLAGVPNRFHTFTGQVWMNKKGFKKLILKSLDKVLVHFSTRVLVDSHSQHLFLIKNNVVSAINSEVLADGSAAGVNINRFKFDLKKRTKIRCELNIPNSAIVFLFLGRLTYDKGILDLLKAFESIALDNDNLHLLIVGPDEAGFDVKIMRLEQKLSGKIHRVGFTKSPEYYMSTADIFCLPSYREGFGSVIIEAAAIGLPAIASRIYGVIDAVDDEVTGLLYEVMNSRELSLAMKKLASDYSLRKSMGAAAKRRVLSKFSEEIVANAMLSFYHDSFTAELE